MVPSDQSTIQTFIHLEFFEVGWCQGVRDSCQPNEARMGHAIQVDRPANINTNTLMRKASWKMAAAKQTMCLSLFWACLECFLFGKIVYLII